MDFLRRHSFLILCGLAVLVGIGLGVTGLQAMPKVEEELRQAKQVYEDLQNLQARPVNQAMIDVEQERIERIKDDAAKVMAEALKLYGYEPLVPGVLPAGENVKRFEFMRRYNAAMNELLESMRCGRPADSSDVASMKERIEREKFFRSDLGVDPGAMPTPRPPTGPAETRAGVLTEDGARENAEARASINKARQIYCYATPFEEDRPPSVPSLWFHPFLKDTGTLEPPFLEDIWWAQLQYWIQKDVVEAINAVNQEAGDAAVSSGDGRWVGIMPVKEIISVRFSNGFIVESEEVFIGPEPGGATQALPCGTAKTVFTKSYSRPEYDVIQYSLKLVMDQRDVLRLVDQITKNRFHVLQRVAYVPEPPNRSMKGKIYGAEPTVNVVLDFEVILMRDAFVSLLPQKVCEDYDHITCPERGD